VLCHIAREGIVNSVVVIGTTVVKFAVSFLVRSEKGIEALLVAEDLFRDFGWMAAKP